MNYQLLCIEKGRMCFPFTPGNPGNAWNESMNGVNHDV